MSLTVGIAEYVLQLRDEASATVTAFSRSLDQKMGVSMRQVGLAASAMGAAITGGISLAIKSAVDFESAFAGVRKVIDGTPDEMDALLQGFRDLSHEVPLSATALMEIGEMAGQLGIKKEGILSFTRTIADLGVSSNLAGEEGAAMLAQFANITQMDQSQFSNLGSTIIALGNNGASTERDIASMGMRIAAAGTMVGMSEGDILGFASALSSVGIESEAGGTAFSRLIGDISKGVAKGGDSLKKWADIAGESAADFKKHFEEDPAGAIESFIRGLAKMKGEGENLFHVLGKLGIEDRRYLDTVMRSTLAVDLLSDSVRLGNEAFQENTALAAEANRRYETTASQLILLKNSVTDFAATIGEILLPGFNNTIKVMRTVVDRIHEWVKVNPELAGAIVKVVAALGTFLTIAGPILYFLPTIISGLQLLSFSWLGFLGPVGLAALAVGALVAIFWDDLKPALEGAVVWVQENAGRMDEVFAGLGGSVAGRLREMAGTLWTWVTETLGPFFAMAVEWVFAGMERLSAAFRAEGVQGALALVVQWVQEAWAAVIGSLEGARAGVGEKMTALGGMLGGEGLGALLSGLGETLGGFGQTLLTGLGSIVDAVAPTLGRLGSIFTNLVNMWWDQLYIIGNILQLVVAVVWEVGRLLAPALDFLTGVLRDYWEMVRQEIEAARGWLTANWDHIQNIFRAGAAAVGAVINALWQVVKTVFMLIFTFLQTGMESFMEGFDAWGNQSYTLIQIFELLAVGIAGALEGLANLLADAAVWIQQHMETIKAVMEFFTDAILGPLGAMVGIATQLVGALVSVLGGIASAIGSLWEGLSSAAAFLSEQWTKLQGTGEGVFSALRNGVQALWDAMTGGVDGVVDAVREAFEDVSQSVMEVLGQIAYGVGYVMGYSSELLYRAFTDPVGLITEAWDGLMGYFTSAWEYVEGLWTDALAGLQAMWGGMTGWFGDLWEQIKSIFWGALGGIGEMLKSVYEWIVSAFTDPIGTISEAWQWVVDLFNWVWESVAAVFQKIVDALKAVKNGVVDAFEWLANMFGQGFSAGMSDAAPGMAVGGMVSAPGVVRVHRDEDIILPRAAEVIPRQHTAAVRDAMGGGGGQVVVNINHPVVREEQDITRITEGVKRVLTEQLGRKAAGRGMRLAF